MSLWEIWIGSNMAETCATEAEAKAAAHVWIGNTPAQFEDVAVLDQRGPVAYYGPTLRVWLDSDPLGGAQP